MDDEEQQRQRSRSYNGLVPLVTVKGLAFWDRACPVEWLDQE